MAGKFPTLGDFMLPAGVFDTHEWMVDYLIDGPTGVLVTLMYPPVNNPCDNCKLDIDTGLSANIYNDTGPVPFDNHTQCPRCGGQGRRATEVTDTMRMRVYWSTRDWIDTGLRIDTPDGIAMTIGYMSDLPKLIRATSLLLNTNTSGITRYVCERMGEAVPYGLRHNRYFIQYVRRVGG